MLGRMTRWLRRKPAPSAPYALPTDDPELTPLHVSGDSAAAAPLEDTAEPLPASRVQAIEEMKAGISDLGAQVRMLAQRLQAQNIGNARLLEALQGLPSALREAMPGGAEHAGALAAMTQALDQQAQANAKLAQILEPLPQLATLLPQTASRQLQAMEQVARHQRAQLRQNVIALRAGKEALASQRKHQHELETSQQSRLAAIQHEGAQGLYRLEQGLRRGRNVQLAVSGAAALAAITALLLAAFAFSGRLTPQEQPDTQAEQQRVVPQDAMVAR